MSLLTSLALSESPQADPAFRDFELAADADVRPLVKNFAVDSPQPTTRSHIVFDSSRGIGSKHVVFERTQRQNDLPDTPQATANSAHTVQPIPAHRQQQNAADSQQGRTVHSADWGGSSPVAASANESRQAARTPLVASRPVKRKPAGSDQGVIQVSATELDNSSRQRPEPAGRRYARNDLQASENPSPATIPSSGASQGQAFDPRADYYRQEGLELLETARRHAEQGNFERARQLVRTASTLPVDWTNNAVSPYELTRAIAQLEEQQAAATISADSVATAQTQPESQATTPASAGRTTWFNLNEPTHEAAQSTKPVTNALAISEDSGPVAQAGHVEVYSGGAVRNGSDWHDLSHVVPPVVAPRENSDQSQPRVFTPTFADRTGGSARSGASPLDRSSYYRELAQTQLAKARDHARRGNFVQARLLARTAQTLPIDWSSSDDSPAAFLKQLETMSGETDAVAQQTDLNKPKRIEPPARPIVSAPPIQDVWRRDDSNPVPMTLPSVPDYAPEDPASEGDTYAEAAPELSSEDTEANQPASESAAAAAAIVAGAKVADTSASTQSVAGTSYWKSLFTDVLVNLVTIFAALVFGLFALLSAAMAVFRKKFNGGGLNVRVELVSEQPLANFVMTPGAAVPNAAALYPQTAEAARTGSTRTTSDASHSDDDFAMNFAPPVLSFEDQQAAEEEELRKREEAILQDIYEQNVELHEQLQELEKGEK